jgi:membrane protein
MNFIAKLLLYCAAWTATQHVGGIPSYEQQRERRRARDAGEVSPGGPGGPGGPGEAASAAAPGR